MSRYLKDSFGQCRFSVDFADAVDSDIVGIKQEADVRGQHLDDLLSRKEGLEEKLESLEKSLMLGDDGDGLSNSVESRLDDLHSELESVEAEVDSLVSELEFLQDLLSEWKSKGYGVSVCFSVGTGFEVVQCDKFHSVVEEQLQELKSRVDRSVKQKLKGENFRLQFTQLDTPHQILQHLYTPLAHPENTVDDERLEELMAMYMAFAGEDLEVENMVRREEKAGAARSINAVLQHLDQTGSANIGDIKSSGPLIGNVSGTELAFGVDPADQPHFYIVGSTGSGKSYTKRVLLENCLSMGYNVVSVTPRDLQALAAFKPFDNDGTGLNGDYYLPTSDLLLDVPNDFSELFGGASFVSLMDLNKADREAFISGLFDAAAEIGKLDNPLFIFLDEAHLFASGESAESIQRAVREVRNFGVHVVLLTQSPMDFNRKYKHIRQNTVGNLFLQGEYWGYAQKYLDSESDITDLGQGEAWVTGRGFSNVLLDIRKPLSRVDEVTREQLEELDALYTGSAPSSEDLGISSSDDNTLESLSSDQKEVVEAIREYIGDEDELPSKNKVIDCSPFGSSKTPRILSELKNMGVVETESAERYGNEATIFRITN
jgi:predicted AAA+ superfamily ATPase